VGDVDRRTDVIDPRELNGRGVRAREALDILRTTITAPQQALSVAFAYATFSNLMRALEQDAGVAPGYFGSAGAALPEINPFDGVEMPAAIGQAPLFVSRPSQDPLVPPTAPPDAPIPSL
jgi:hypothetical protein